MADCVENLPTEWRTNASGVPLDPGFAERQRTLRKCAAELEAALAETPTPSGPCGGTGMVMVGGKGQTPSGEMCAGCPACAPSSSEPDWKGLWDMAHEWRSDPQYKDGWVYGERLSNWLAKHGVKGEGQ